MAGNHGKYIDRSPIICPAGLSVYGPYETVKGAFEEYKVADGITALKHEANIWKEDEFVVPRNLPPAQNPSFNSNTELRGILNPPAKSRYQQLIQDLKDTPYSSFWNAEVGKTRDPTPGLPAGMIPKEVTFGKPTPREWTMKELVSPPKTPYQVLWEGQIGHEMYRKTHNDYNPSERVNRGYAASFNPDKCYGLKTRYDKRGIWAKCAMDWYSKEPVTVISKIQGDYLERVRPKLGKVLAPNNNIECVPEGHTFGDSTRQAFYGVEELLKDQNVAPSLLKRDIYQCVSALNQLTLQLEEKKKKKGLRVKDFYKRCLYYDKKRLGVLNADFFYDLCVDYGIIYEKNDIHHLLEHLKIIDGDNLIRYEKFINLLSANDERLVLDKIHDIPPENQYYVTTQQAARCDLTIINNTVLPPAGIPSIRHDLPRPIVPPRGCRADLMHLGNDTTAATIVNPSIYTSYGLTYRDFFVPRQPKFIKSLFEKLGYNFPDKSFENLWKIGLEMDKTGSVCVETFKNLLQAKCQSGKLFVDEHDLECKKM